MKLEHLDAVLKHFTGKPIVQPQRDNLEKPEEITSMKPLTLRMALEQPFGMPEEKKNPDERVKSFKIGAKVFSATAETEFTSEEITFIKQQVDKVGYSDLIAGQICLLLENQNPFS